MEVTKKKIIKTIEDRIGKPTEIRKTSEIRAIAFLDPQNDFEPYAWEQNFLMACFSINGHPMLH